LTENELIAKEKKGLRVAYGSTSVQHAFRKKKQKLINFEIRKEKEKKVDEYFKKKINKWKNESHGKSLHFMSHD